MKPFAVNWDYRCPFARNAHEHLVAALADGADWDVTFLPFSLSQVHVAEGGTAGVGQPGKGEGSDGARRGVVVRDQYPERFLDAHVALFAARHDEGLDLRVPEVVAGVLDGVGRPGRQGRRGGRSPDAPIKEIRRAHEQAVNKWATFGVPTFVVDDRAVFVRIMSRPKATLALARRTIDGVLQLFDTMPDLNEFKHTTLTR